MSCNSPELCPIHGAGALRRAKRNRLVTVVLLVFLAGWVAGTLVERAQHPTTTDGVAVKGNR